MEEYGRIRMDQHHLYTVAIQKAVGHLEDTFQAVVDRNDAV